MEYPEVRVWLLVLVAAALLGAFLRPFQSSPKVYEDCLIYAVVLRSEIPKGMVYVDPQCDIYAAPSNRKRESYEPRFDRARYNFALGQLKPEPQTVKSFEKANWTSGTISPNFQDPRIHVLGQGRGY